MLQVGDGEVVLDELAATLWHAGRSGSLSGKCQIDMVDRCVTATLSTSGNPRAVLPWLDGMGWRGFAALIRRFALTEASSSLIKAGFVYRMEERAFDLNGRVLLRDFSYRGVTAQRGECDVGVSIAPEHFEVTVGDLYLVRPEGVAQVDLAFQPRERRLELAATSDFDIQALARVANVLTNLVGSRLTFEGPSHCQFDGVVMVAGATGSDLRGHIETAQVTAWGIQTGPGAVDIIYEGATATVTNGVADFCGGALTVGVKASREDEGWRTQLGVRVEGAELAEYMQQRGRSGEEGPQGQLAMSLDLDLLARPGKPLVRAGEGAIRIDEGHVFRLPFFGGLTALLAKYVPGVDFLLRQEELAVDFTIEGERAHSERITIGGDVFSFSASGDYYLDGRLHYDGQIRLFKGHTLVGKVAQLFVLPISKLFEFELRGTVADPSWRLSNFSRDDDDDEETPPPAADAGEPDIPEPTAE